MPLNTDPKAQVYDGKAGSGEAFILQNLWQYPLNAGLRQDAQHAASLQRQHQQDATLRAAREKEANALLAERLSVDYTKAAPQDQQELHSLFVAEQQRAAEMMGKGKHPGLMENAKEASVVWSGIDNIKALAAASQQRNAELGANLKVMNEDADGIYGSKADYLDRVNSWSALSLAERAKTPPPALDEVIIPEKLAAKVVSELKLSKTTEARRNGLQITETSDETLSPEAHQLAVDQLTNTPAWSRKMAGIYQGLPEAQRPPSLAVFLNSQADRMVTAATPKIHDEHLTFQQPRPEPANQENKKFQVERADEEKSVVTALTNWAQMRSGSPDLYNAPVAGHPELLGTDKFNSYAFGTYNGKPNQVLGMARNAEGRIFLATNASKGAYEEVNDANVYDKLLVPMWNGSNYKGGLESLSRVASRYMTPGTNTLDVSSLGTQVTPQQNAAVASTIKGNQAYSSAIQQKVAELGAQVGNGTQVSAENVSAFNVFLKKGAMQLGGQWLKNPVLKAEKDEETGETTLKLEADVPSADGKKIERKAIPVTAEQLQKIGATYVPPKSRLKAAAKPRVTAAKAGTPAAKEVARATEDVKRKGTGKSSGSSEKANLLGLAVKAPKAEPAKQDKPAKKAEKVNLLGLKTKTK